jgi:hypothetical protein
VRTARIARAGFSALEQWIGDHRRLWERRLDALGEILDDDL